MLYETYGRLESSKIAITNSLTRRTVEPKGDVSETVGRLRKHKRINFGLSTALAVIGATTPVLAIVGMVKNPETAGVAPWLSFGLLALSLNRLLQSKLNDWKLKSVDEFEARMMGPVAK